MKILQRREWTLLLALVLAIGVLGGCDDDDATETGGGTTSDFNVSLVGGDIVIRHQGRHLFTLESVELQQFRDKSILQVGFYDFNAVGLTTTDISWRGEANGDVTLVGPTGDFGLLTSGTDANGNLEVDLQVTEPGFQGMRLAFTLGPDDRFWGFGEQFNYVDFRGEFLETWVTEQGVRREKDPPPFGVGSYYDSYYPMPFFVDPGRGVGFLLTNFEYNTFDLGKEDPNRWFIDVWRGTGATFKVFPGPTTKDVVGQLTAEVGRPQSPPPSWAFSGTWLAAQGGNDVVRAKLQDALDANVPVTAVWCQDWVGVRPVFGGGFGVKYHWIHDDTLYPNLDQFIDELEAKGVRFLGYFNQFVDTQLSHWDTMAANGWMLQNQAGEPYPMWIPFLNIGAIDPTDPAAIDYFQGFARQATDLGIRGWMCDFGEWSAYDAVFEAGSGAVWHNQYPREWQRINREVLEEAYPDGNWIMFTRSGYTYNQSVTQILWAGDQEANWEEGDGIPTVVTAGLTAGLSGIPYFTHDIAGFSGGPSEKELYQRWTELGAFTPIMRTHEGLDRFNNHQFNSDPETLAHFSKMARVHAALTPYWQSLAQEAVDTGLPMIRHTAMVDPEWDLAYDAHTQWMLGDDVVFAPVVHEGDAYVDFWLPEGDWEYLWNANDGVVSGRRQLNRDAIIGRPAVYVRAGTMPEILAEIRRIHAE